jgi:hypothetical protein
VGTALSEAQEVSSHIDISPQQPKLYVLARPPLHLLTTEIHLATSIHDLLVDSLGPSIEYFSNSRRRLTEESAAIMRPYTDLNNDFLSN